MSDQSRVEATLGQMFRDHFFNDTYPEDETECCVEEFLEALKANRIALVELPEKFGEDARLGPRRPYWRTLIGNEPEDVYPSPLGHIVISGAARLDSAGEARDLAAALLAAAAEVTE
ncbi:hypothetical protein SEA_GIGIOUIOUI_59 [Mycobacterium phage GigiOuiOui]|uniref:Uncharacterized protein n=1 Tax=Mycobacterium phage Soul22 TaxID=2743996 RepID=A0A7D5FT53_9CAUD|nr:DNA methyltransferase [Mycobacterium phage Soul22]QLF84288.1 hypothetical protein SEA_SOUL22_69 [Mycobacterium phage Soul22]UXE03032.1 hypothetical protein SEA_GIGIOUIOUI_59 [Mycobacterium phage GigiOuiOui]